MTADPGGALTSRTITRPSGPPALRTPPRTITPSFRPHLVIRRATLRQLGTFGAIGVVSTLAYVAVYAALRTAWPAGASNAAALLLTAIGNTAANRRFTFEVHGRRGLARDHAAGLVGLGGALVITSASLGALDLVAPRAGRALEVAVLIFANATATAVRFAVLRLAIGPSRRTAGASVPAATDTPATERTTP